MRCNTLARAEERFREIQESNAFVGCHHQHEDEAEEMEVVIGDLTKQLCTR